MSDYNKHETIRYFPELKELNKILIRQKEQLNLKNDPETIAVKIPQAQELIELLINKLNLTNIEFHDKINEHSDEWGMAYRFGNPKTEHNYSFVIFAQNPTDLKKFRHYEQFSDCGKFELIEESWAISRITVGCNN